MLVNQWPPECADIAYEVALDQGMPASLRSTAVSVLVTLDDPQVTAIAESLRSLPDLWDEEVIRRSFAYLFPHHLPLASLEKILVRVREGKGAVG
ncbi:hypothetical protein HJA87_15830 [Rhizobium bangladeshense]|uniref:HEAT repeat domain-containing protein n=1 Tax=Rhizobium bangladeshense TaxID=1138189 RepID=A0ABS7LJ75_9HYPH|nr:hypothetical protein [Rhizobium bangladeshense]MBY3591328.1 hypothetical protein [Rhizobium bangladeshense]